MPAAIDVDQRDRYEAAVQRELLDLARKRESDILRLRANIEALGGASCSNYDDGYNRAVIDAVALIDRALTEACGQ